LVACVLEDVGVFVFGAEIVTTSKKENGHKNR
jgi:hypothetical protein